MESAGPWRPSGGEAGHSDSYVQRGEDTFCTDRLGSHLGLQHSNIPSKNSCAGNNGTRMPRQCMHAGGAHFQYPNIAGKAAPVTAIALRAVCIVGPNMFLFTADCRLQWQATPLLR